MIFSLLALAIKINARNSSILLKLTQKRCFIKFWCIEKETGTKKQETFAAFQKKKKNVRLLSRPFKKLLQPVLAQLPHCSPVTLPSQIYSLTHGSDPNTKTTKIMRLSEGNLQVLMPCSGTLLIQNLVVVSLPPEHSP